EVLSRTVNLQSESVLIDVLSITLQHAVVTSIAYQGKNLKLKRLAKIEVNKRKKDLQRLHQLNKTKVPYAEAYKYINVNDLSYQKSIIKNHARIIELAEFGSSLKISNSTRYFLKSLLVDVIPEILVFNKILEP
ncbi:MAG: hypothetical protein ACRC01_09105, partial [Deefgea sp.]